MFKINELKRQRLSRDFYNRPTLKVARDLLGKYIVSKRYGQLKIAQITETEAYIGLRDQASHARFGKTKRNEIMWGQAGNIYVYLIYGIHHLVNIITEPEGFPAAVLIRSAKPIQGLNPPRLSPSKLTKTFRLKRNNTGLDLTKSKDFFIADSNYKPKKIIRTPRIGIKYANLPWSQKKWRFLISE